MNATQAKRTLEAAARKAGGQLEEDNAHPPMRCYQMVAPAGRVWAGNSAKHVCVRVDRQRASHATKWNAAEVALCLEIIADGHRTMTETEAFECDETPA